MNWAPYILFILFVSSGYSFAQSNTDSLFREYRTARVDTSKLDLLLKLVKAHGYDNVDTAIYFAKQAQDMARKLGDKNRQADADASLATYYTVQSNYQKALTYDLEALRLYTEIDYGRGIITSLNNIGEDYYDLDLFSDAYDYYQRSLKKAQQLENKLMIAIATYNIGRVLKSMGQLKKSLNYIQESLELSGAIDDQEGLAYSLHDIGEILMMERNYTEAQKKLEEALIISKKLKITVLTPQILQKIALAHENQKRYKQALSYYDSALFIYRDLNGRSGMAQAYLGKGVVRMKMNDYPQAKDYMFRSLNISQHINSSELMIEGYIELSRLYEKMGLLRKSLDYYKMYKGLEDKVFGEKKTEQFAQIQIKYETANKDMEISLLNQQEEQRKSQLEKEEFFRNILVVILAFTGVLLITLYRSSMRRKKINELLVKHQSEMEEQSREMAGLLQMKDKFFSILSHDLRSPINALMGTLYIIEKSDISQDELKQLTNSLQTRLRNTKKLLDNLLDWALVQMNEITIQSEDIDVNKLVQDNITFFKETSDKQIQFRNNVSQNTMVTADRNMLDLIMRNLMANAVKFTEESGVVEVTAEHESKDILNIKIKDSGIGMNKKQRDHIFNKKGLHSTRGTANEMGTGLGLKLCKEFVERMGGRITVESTEGKGSTFLFTLKKASLF